MLSAPPAPATITEIRGDLFSSGRQDGVRVLVHCVSGDLRLTRGIARQFLRRYGGRLELR